MIPIVDGDVTLRHALRRFKLLTFGGAAVAGLAFVYLISLLFR